MRAALPMTANTYDAWAGVIETEGRARRRSSVELLFYTSLYLEI
jgi:hypothetical protein